MGDARWLTVMTPTSRWNCGCVITSAYTVHEHTYNSQNKNINDLFRYRYPKQHIFRYFQIISMDNLAPQ